MDVVKIYSLMCHPVQQQTISNWQQKTGDRVEHHCSIPGLRRAIAGCDKAIVFAGWYTRFRERSCNTIRDASELLTDSSYLIALSRNDHEHDIEQALTLGADRFVRTDVATTIFTELMNAVLRRMIPNNGVRHFPPYCINQMTREVHVADEIIQLTPREFLIAQYLFENRERIVTRTTLLRDVWGLPALDHNRRVDTKISHVRRKISLDGTYGWSLRFPRGKGYQLNRASIQHPASIGQPSAGND